jgi:transcriptional regulator GlxA family with amidase domain
MVAAASAILRTALPAPDPQVERIAAILQVAESHTDITQVQQLADHVGISVRKLQMLFKDYIGASPKWIIRRKRLLDAADLLAKGSDIDLATLAQQLGYYDQPTSRPTSKNWSASHPPTAATAKRLTALPSGEKLPT